MTRPKARKRISRSSNLPLAMSATQATERKTTTAPVLEVFASIQGEGLYVGEPQVFVRLFGCPFRCRWCDTPGSLALPEKPRARLDSSGGRRHADGWASPFLAATWIASAESGSRRTVSVTGGEPLQWPGFVRSLRRFVAPRRVHLETAGGHPRALAQVLPAVDHVSLDLKLSEDLDPPVPLPVEELEQGTVSTLDAPPVGRLEWAQARAACLFSLRGHDACAKIPFSGNHPASRYAPLLDDVAGIAAEMPVVLQPITALPGAEGVIAPGRELFDELTDMALSRGLHVRLLPQVHRYLHLP